MAKLQLKKVIQDYAKSKNTDSLRLGKFDVYVNGDGSVEVQKGKQSISWSNLTYMERLEIAYYLDKEVEVPELRAWLNEPV